MRYLYLLLSFMLLMPAPVIAQGKPDVKALLGSWEGEYEAGPLYKGPMYLTVKSVGPDDIRGTRYTKGGARYHNQDLAVVGKVNDDGTITLSHAYASMTLTYSPPDTLTGLGAGQLAATVSFKRKK